MKKIISYSLWGDNPKYCVGAIKNAEMRDRFYPDWIARFYVHKSVDQKYINKLRSTEGVEVIIKDGPADWTAMFWRFEAISDEDVEIMICRDTDSRLSDREAQAVKEFENSPCLFHIMRDHPYHNAFVLGGMFGVKKGILDDMTTLCEDFQSSDVYGTDYAFFNSIKHRIPSFVTLVHDEFRGGRSFPSPRNNKEFVGDVFDENDNRHPDYYKLL